MCGVINLTNAKEIRQFDMSDCIFPRERYSVEGKKNHNE